jgi:hypothetical protein
MSKQLSEDSTSSCAFIYADGRQCRMLRSLKDSPFCCYHARKLRHLEEHDQTASKIAAPVRGDYVPVTALTQTLSRVFCAVVEGRMDPKQAIALSRVSNALLKSIEGSTKEFQECYKDGYWRQLIYSHYKNLPEYEPDDEEKEQEEAPEPKPSKNPPLPKTAAEILTKLSR